MERPLIIGGDGAIARALEARLRQSGLSPRVTTRRKEMREKTGGLYLDLAAAPDGWPELPEADVVFFCAAETRLESCEDAPAATRRVNVEHMQALAERVQARNGFVVFLSTNQVFDGAKPYRRADEPVCPLNEYGRQKAAFEKWLLSRPQPAAVLRLTKVVTDRLPILAQWTDRLQKGETVKAFGDLRFAPLPIAAALEGMLDLARRKKGGIHQLSGLRDVSYYEVACALAQGLGADTAQVASVGAAEAGMRAQFLPRHGTLDRATMAHIAVPEPDDYFPMPLHPARVSPKRSTGGGA